MSILTVNGLCKKYPAFELSDISFTLGAGKITGFIGRNGAGKSTTLKSLFDLVHPDAGEILFFDSPAYKGREEILQRVGFVPGGVNYYPTKKLSAITAVTKSFYKTWDDTAYKEYCTLFNLDQNKTPSQLSAGMCVKYSLALALSHGAELLILDEPTSGLDPVSRDELLEIFLNLCDRGTTILFSTHITSDLEKCADDIIYIKEGKLIAESTLDAFIGAFWRVKYLSSDITDQIRPMLIGEKREKLGFSALIRAADSDKVPFECERADLQDIMVHLEKEENVCSVY